MNIKPSSVLLLSLMLCSAQVRAHDFSSKTILTSYAQNKDLKVISAVLGKLDLTELNQLENDLRTVQMQGRGEDFGPVLAQVKRHKQRIYTKLGALAVPPLVVGVLGACFDKSQSKGGNFVSYAGAMAVFTAFPGVFIVRRLLWGVF